MEPGQTDFFEKVQQESMLAHFIRCPRFHTLVLTGKVTQEDFDFVHLRVVFQAMVGVLTIQGGAGNIYVEPLIDQIRKIQAANSIHPSEQEALLSFLASAYNRQLSDDYHWGRVEEFIGQQRAYKELKKIKPKDWRDVGTILQDSAFKARIMMPEPFNPLKDMAITPMVDAVPTGIASIDSKLSGGGLGKKEYGILCAYTGVGKCLGLGTPIIKFDGSVIKVEDIVAGDLLMGPDSKPRKVLSTCRGKEEMFRVDQRNGDSFTCNRSHILSLKRTGHCQISSGPSAKSINRRGEIVNISVDDYLKQKDWFKHFYKMWKAPIEFPEAELPIDPYIFGLWLGDGTSAKTHFTTADIEIEQAIVEFAVSQEMNIREVIQKTCKTICLSKGGKNPFLKSLKEMDVLSNKHIPSLYLRSSSSQRMRLLAGIIDTDGYCPKRSVAIVTSIRKDLAEDILFLARSLGFMCSLREKKTSLKSRDYTGIAYNITICGDVLEIPTRLKRRRPEGNVQRKQQVNAFSLSSIGEGDYYGFTLEGDGLFLLGDFTVSHNTTLSLNFAWGAARHRKKACFGTLELTKDKIVERYYALVARYSYDAIRFGRPPHRTREEIWEEVVQIVTRNAGIYQDYFQIWDFSEEICTISILEDWVKREIDRDPHNPPQLLVVDWLLCLDEDMKTFNPKQMNGSEVRHKLQRYSDELSKKIARKYNIAVWATHQADAKAEGVETVTTKHSAEGKSAAWKCTVFLGVGATPEQKDKGIFVVTASKTRDGSNFSCRIRGVLSEQRFESINEEGEDPSPEDVTSSGIEAAILAGNTGIDDSASSDLSSLIPSARDVTFTLRDRPETAQC
jgi:replicative DNA helicase